MSVKWYMKRFIYWTADLKSSKPWSSQFLTQFKHLRTEAWNSQDFNGVWTRDLAVPMRRSNQLSYEATWVWCPFVILKEGTKINRRWSREISSFFNLCQPLWFFSSGQICRRSTGSQWWSCQSLQLWSLWQNVGIWRSVATGFRVYWPMGSNCRPWTKGHFLDEIQTLWCTAWKISQHWSSR